MTTPQKGAVKFLSERSFLDFTQIWFQMLQGEKMLVNWHHIYAAEMADKLIAGELGNKSLIVNFPPGGTKTEFFSVHLPAYTNTLVSIGRLNKFRNLTCRLPVRW